MLRYRRYRGFVVFVVFAIVGIYFLLAGNPDWQPASAITAGALQAAGVPQDKDKVSSHLVPASEKKKFEDFQDDIGRAAEEPVRKVTEPDVVDAVPKAKITATKTKAGLAAADKLSPTTVSYTHLTLPTKRIV